MYTSVSHYVDDGVTWVVEPADDENDVVVHADRSNTFMTMSRAEAAQLRDALTAALDDDGQAES